MGCASLFIKVLPGNGCDEYKYSFTGRTAQDSRGLEDVAGDSPVGRGPCSRLARRVYVSMLNNLTLSDYCQSSR